MLLTRGVPRRVTQVVESGDEATLVDSGLALGVFPLGVVAAVAVWHLPGLLLTVGRNAREGFALWFLHGSLVSLGLQWGLGAALVAAHPGRVPSDHFIGIWCALTLLLAARRWVVDRKGGAPPPLGPVDARRFGWAAALVGIGVWVGFRSILHTELTSDGFEALEIGRSLSWFAVPRYPGEQGLFGLGAGMVAMAPPVRWFVDLYGPLDVASRLPLFLGLPTVLAGLLVVIEHRAPRRLSALEELALIAGLGGVFATLAWNATYGPYLVDPASPTALAVTTLGLLLGALAALVRGSPGWFVGFAVAALLARPTAVIVVVLAAGGIALTDRERRGPALKLLALALAAWAATYGVYERAFLGSETAAYPAESLLDRFRYLRLWDPLRLAWVGVPAGIAPFAALFLWRRQDPWARSLTLVVAGYLAVVALPAFVALHHLVPAMVLPLAVFWRLGVFDGPPSHLRVGLAAVGSAAAILLALPRSGEGPTPFRTLGPRALVEVGRWDGDSYQEHGAFVEASTEAAGLLFGYDWDVEDPGGALVAGGQVAAYAGRRDSRSAPAPWVVVRDLAAPAPPGAEASLQATSVRIHVMDTAAVTAFRFRSRATWPQALLYRIPPTTLRSYRGIPARSYDLDLGSLPLLWRLFAEAGLGSTGSGHASVTEGPHRPDADDDVEVPVPVLQFLPGEFLRGQTVEGAGGREDVAPPLHLDLAVEIPGEELPGRLLGQVPVLGPPVGVQVAADLAGAVGGQKQHPPGLEHGVEAPYGPLDVVDHLDRLGADDAVEPALREGGVARQIPHDGGPGRFDVAEDILHLDGVPSELVQVEGVAELHGDAPDVLAPGVQESLDVPTFDGKPPIEGEDRADGGQAPETAEAHGPPGGPLEAQGTLQLHDPVPNPWRQVVLGQVDGPIPEGAARRSRVCRGHLAGLRARVGGGWALSPGRGERTWSKVGRAPHPGNRRRAGWLGP